MSMPNSRSCSACIAQRARSRTIGCPGRPARTDFTSIRTLAVLERSCSKSHFIPFANATSQTMPLRWSVAFPIVSACPNVLAVGTALAIKDLNPPGVGRASAMGSLAISWFTEEATRTRQSRSRRIGGPTRARPGSRSASCTLASESGTARVNRSGTQGPADTSRPGPRARPALLPTSHAHCGLKEASSGRPAGAS
jgi:hypothetical protein